MENESNERSDNGVQALRDQFAALQAKLENIGTTVSDIQTAAQPAVASEPEYKEVTNDEIRSAVDAGTISESQADQIRESQIERRVAKKLKEDITATDKQTRISGMIEQYRTSFPDLQDKASKTFKRVQKEFAVLVDLGMDPSDPKTEFAAVRSALGEPVMHQQQPASPFQEVGGGYGGGESDEEGGPPWWVKGELRSFYQKQIDNGYYKGWDDPVGQKELGQSAGRFKDKIVA